MKSQSDPSELESAIVRGSREKGFTIVGNPHTFFVEVTLPGFV